MKHCAEFVATVQLLLDGELVDEELDRAQGHLASCSACRQLFEEEAKLSQLIRQSRSFDSAPASLRERVGRITQETSVSNWPAKDSNNSAIMMPSRPGASSTFFTRERFALVAALLLLAVGGILFPHLLSRSRANRLIDTAILADSGLSTQDLPLDVQSSSPEEVVAWFKGRVPFQFRLPNAGIAGQDTAKYRMLGGRLIDLKGERAAVVSFRMSNEHISLLIASDRVAHAVGGTISESDGIAFHSRQMKSHNIVTWDNKGLTYALVFSSSPSGRRACSACHESSHENGQSPINKAYLTQPF